jgi:hypothetical protein
VDDDIAGQNPTTLVEEMLLRDVGRFRQSQLQLLGLVYDLGPARVALRVF